MNKKAKMMERIANHGADLDALFPDAKKHGVALCKAIRKIEADAIKITTAFCNGEINEAQQDLQSADIENRLNDLLGEQAVKKTGVFINWDARGCAIKMNRDFIAGYRSKGGRIYADWGGYGILAPDFTND